MMFLITGGCGFLGFSVTQRLVAQKRGRVTVFDNLSRIGTRENLTVLEKNDLIDFVPGDVRDRDLVETVIERIRPDVIYHLAGQVAMTTSLGQPRFDFEVNVLGTINVLEAVRRQSPHSIIVYSSSNKVYGDLDYLRYTELETRYRLDDFPKGLNESTRLDFTTPYGCSKGAADRYVSDYARMFDIRTVVLRHSSIYGVNQRSTVDQGWVGWFLSEMLSAQNEEEGKTIAVAGDGKQVRDLLFCTDAAELYSRIPDYIDSASGMAFNVGGGVRNAMSILELVRFAENKLGTQVKLQHNPRRRSDQKVFISDNSLASKVFEWQPTVSFESGILQTVEWLKDGSARSHN